MRHDVAGQQLDLTGRGVDRPEHERVEAVGDEPGERLDPPVGRSREWFAGQIPDRKLRPGWRRPVADHALQVEDPPDRARITARLLGRRVDPLVAGAQLVTREHAERRQPAVRLAADEAEHPRLERSHPDPDRVRGSWAGARAIEPVVLASNDTERSSTTAA